MKQQSTLNLNEMTREELMNYFMQEFSSAEMKSATEQKKKDEKELSLKAKKDFQESISKDVEIYRKALLVEVNSKVEKYTNKLVEKYNDEHDTKFTVQMIDSKNSCTTERKTRKDIEELVAELQELSVNVKVEYRKVLTDKRANVYSDRPHVSYNDSEFKRKTNGVLYEELMKKKNELVAD